MVELKHSETLRFSFPEVHKDAVLYISFERTLRVPDDGRMNSLPPGFSCFTMKHVEDHADKVPSEWKKHGGVLMPMYQSEAMWMSFDSPEGYPFAVKIACGKCCAITGNQWEEGLTQGERRAVDDEENLQNYVVVPDQPWLDGFNVGQGEVRQFVAMPLGQGITVEEQLTGEANYGGVQIQVFPLKRKVWEHMRKRHLDFPFFDDDKLLCCCYQSSEMGLGAGGRIHQEIYKDEHQLKDWDLKHTSRVFVHLLNAEQWTEVTGEPMPHKPFDTDTYNRFGFPWFEYYSDALAVAGSSKLAKVKSVAEWNPDFKGEDVAEPKLVIKETQKKQQRGLFWVSCINRDTLGKSLKLSPSLTKLRLH